MSGVVRSRLRKSTYDSLKAMIVTGQLAPGARLTEVELAARLEVSRTPIREALNKLERDGMVVARPRQGYAVIDFNMDMLQEIFDVRQVLDGHATELATRRITENDKKNLRSILAECERLAAIPNRSPEDMFRELQVGTNLHRTIAELSGNETLCTMLGSLLEKCMHYIWLELVSLDDWKEARAEHAAIVEAMCAGDALQAGQCARNHIRASGEAIVKLFKARTEIQSFMMKAS